jgi:hypothetical protein
MMLSTPWGSKTTFVPSHFALDVNSVHSRSMSTSLNLGFDVMLRHALSTSIFLSLFSVFGRDVPAHEITEPRLESLFRKLVAKGDRPADSIRFAISPLVLGQASADWQPLSESEAGLSLCSNSGSELFDEGEDEDAGECVGTLPIKWLTPAWCATGLSEDTDEAGPMKE